MEKEIRPWGWFRVLQRGDKYCGKELWVEPNLRLSYQFHRYRTEDWVVVEGDGVITRNDLEENAKVGDTFFIGIEQRHRIKGGERGMRIIEVQRGKCMEDDIVRIADDFDRARENAWGQYL